MTSKDSSQFDYLRGLVKDQISQLRGFGPITLDIFEILQTSQNYITIDPLIERIMDKHQVVVCVEADMMNMRQSPSIQAPVIKVLERGALLTVRQEDERKIGESGQWLNVLDSEGSWGYVVANYVSLDQRYGRPESKIDTLMQTLEQLHRMDLVTINPTSGEIHLTSKGDSIAKMLQSNEF